LKSRDYRNWSEYEDESRRSSEGVENEKLNQDRISVAIDLLNSYPIVEFVLNVYAKNLIMKFID
jgi:hypothetical protein